MKTFLLASPLALLLASSVGCGDDSAQGGGAATTSTSSPSATNASGTSATGAVTGSTTSSGTGGGDPGRPFAYVGCGDDKIRVFEVDPDTAAFTAAGEFDGGSNPSFLAFSPDKKMLYAVNESSSEISSFAIDQSTGALTFKNKVSSNGDGPAHVAVDATGKFVFAANYGGGTMTMIDTLADGSLGSDPVTIASGSHSHEVVLDPSNAFVFVPVLGNDAVAQLVFDSGAGTLVPNDVPEAPVANGAGPRHMVFHPTAPFAYVIDETDDTMVAASFDATTGRITPFQTVSTLPDGFDGDNNTCAEVAFGKSGRFLYGSNRGHDSIVIFDVDPATGMMTLVGHQPTDGQTPRHFSIDPSGKFLYVGNQQSNEVVKFRIDENSGTLTELDTQPLPAGPGFVGVIYLPP